MKTYSLANYIITIIPDEADTNLRQAFGSAMSIGGEGKYLGSITVGTDKNLWEVQGFATGAYVFDKNLSRTGTCRISLHQLADEVIKFIHLCNLYYKGEYGGCYITVSDTKGNKVANCKDCYIQKYADQQYNETSGSQDWQFVCGEITFAPEK